MNPLLAVGMLFGAWAAIGAPISTIVIGAALFGVAHVFGELRFLAGRYTPAVGRSLIGIVVPLAALIAVDRLAVSTFGHSAQWVEVVLAHVLLGLVASQLLGGWRRAVALTAVLVSAIGGLARPSMFPMVLAVVHLVVPAVLLWEWSRDLPVRSRRWFRGGQVVWALVVPALVLVGVADRWLDAGAGAARSIVGDGEEIIVAAVPDGLSPTLTLRALAVVAFLHVLHYLIWLVIVPWFATSVTVDFERRFPWLTGARLWAIAFAGSAVVAVVIVVDSTTGLAVTRSLEAFSAYLEVTVLIALVGGRADRVRRPLPDTRDVAAGSAPRLAPGPWRTPLQNSQPPRAEKALSSAAHAPTVEASMRKGGGPRSDFFRNE